MESRKELFDKKENLINTRLRDSLLNQGYFVADQSLGGESESKISEGERDLVIRGQAGECKSILEGVCLSGITKNKINTHYDKLINNYDTSINKFNYMIVYSKVKRFDDFCSNYESFFEKKGHYGK